MRLRTRVSRHLRRGEKMRHFTIIGAGLGTPEGLTGEAKAALLSAGRVFGTRRLAVQLSGLRAIETCAFTDLAERAKEADAERVALLVSGDPGFFSAAQTLRQVLTRYGTVETLCGISSLQAFCALLGERWEDAVLLSLHGRAGSLLGAVSYHKKVFALTGGEKNASQLCRELTEAGLGAAEAAIGENLGTPEARIFRGTAAEAAERKCSSLAVLLVQNTHPADPSRALFDCDFVRGNVPMTKQEVRWTAVSLLSPTPEDIVYDIGAGTGSVALELGRRAYHGTVYAVERKPEALTLLEQNRRALGGFNVLPVAGDAPGALESLPAPDTVFIGGSGGELRGILRLLHSKNPAVRVVISAVSLETLEEARRGLAECGFGPAEVCQIASARGRSAGPYTMLTANNPVFLISGGGMRGA